MKLNRLTDKEFYEILELFSVGNPLSALLRQRSYSPIKFIQKTLTGDAVKALDFCIAARRNREWRSAHFKKLYRTNRCMPLSYLDVRSAKRTGIRMYYKQSPLSMRECKVIDDYLFNKDL